MDAEPRDYPGVWYGVGTALEAFTAGGLGGLDLLQTMYKEWSFFQALIENVELDVAKADMGIAALYAGLVTDDRLRDEIFEVDAGRTCARLPADLRDHRGRLNCCEHSPVMQRSIERRKSVRRPPQLHSGCRAA